MARRRSDRGAAAIEFALLLPLLLLLVFGGIDFGYAVNRGSLLNNAAREGAREAIFDSDPIAIEARVRSAASDLDQAQLTVDISCRKPDLTPCPGVSFPNEWESGGMVIVNVQYDYDYITSIPHLLGFGSSHRLSSTVEMFIE